MGHYLCLYQQYDPAVEQMHGLQAKVATLTLHPGCHTWKVLMPVAFGRHVPGLGHAALVS